MAKLKRDKTRIRVKKKSIKTKALNLNSKRKLAKFGSKQKKGHAGTAIRYITRSRALKKLGLSLKDFRRLCILKGIYPREPKNRSFSKTCYHVKDIMYLAHEPLLEKFRLFKIFMKKVKKRLHRGNRQRALELYEQKEEYTLEHLVRERYPTFKDSLADLDDALCLIHLFASMHSIGSVTSQRVENCLRLTREWQLYVVLSRSLRKSFVSVKGIYYQCEVNGETITWLVPHKFAQDVPREVDMRVMSTFLEFYECLLGFVMFKLYHNLGLRYPPRLDMELDKNGAHLACVQPERKEDTTATPVEDKKMDVEEEEEEEEEEEGEEEEDGDEGSSSSDEDEDDDEEEGALKSAEDQIRKSEQRMKDLSSHLHEFIKYADEDKEVAKKEEQDEEDRTLEKEVFAEEEEMLDKESRELKRHTNLFKGLMFFLSREVPFEPLEFVIRAFGGDVCDDAKNPKLTHYISDRPALKQDNPNVEYVQPQWVFDSANFRLCLPVQRYAIDAKLPPHLSPFVDNENAGYKPDYAVEIEKLQAAAGILGVQPIDEDSQDQRNRDVEEADDESDQEEKEAKYVEDLRQELIGREKESSKKTNKKEKKQQKKLADAPVEESATEKDISSQQDDDDSDDDEEEEAKAKEEDDKKQKKTTKKTKVVQQQQEESEEEEEESGFIGCKKFLGRREGMVFQNGPQGLGYYEDEFKRRQITFKKGKIVSNRQKRLQQKQEEHQMRQMLMSGKAKKLYNKMQHGIKRKQDDAAELQRRKEARTGKKKSKK